jgi:hypothetical protein
MLLDHRQPAIAPVNLTIIRYTTTPHGRPTLSHHEDDKVPLGSFRIRFIDHQLGRGEGRVDVLKFLPIRILMGTVLPVSTAFYHQDQDMLPEPGRKSP